MTTMEKRDHPTPAGGVRSVIYYRDAEGRPADKAAAAQAEVVEYDRRGRVLARTYASLHRPGAAAKTDPQE